MASVNPCAFPRYFHILGALLLGLLAGCGQSPDPQQTIRDNYFYGGLAAFQENQPDEAARQWRRAAELGDGEAARNLGHLYRLGRGVPADGQMAAAMYRQAVAAGVVSAEYNLGMLYLKGGEGLAPDRDEGLKYLGQAAEKGYGPAKEELRKVSAMTAAPSPPPEIAPPPGVPADAVSPSPAITPEAPPPAVLRVQIGSYRTKSGAEEDWNRLRAPDLGHQVIGNKVEGKGHWYRLVVEGPEDRIEALCAAAPARGMACQAPGRRFPAGK